MAENKLSFQEVSNRTGYYICKFKDGTILISQEKPIIDGEKWHGSGVVATLNSILFEPYDVNWKESLITPKEGK